VDGKKRRKYKWESVVAGPRENPGCLATLDKNITGRLRLLSSVQENA